MIKNAIIKNSVDTSKYQLLFDLLSQKMVPEQPQEVWARWVGNNAHILSRLPPPDEWMGSGYQLKSLIGTGEGIISSYKMGENELEDFDLDWEGILLGVGEIPNLFVYVGRAIEGSWKKWTGSLSIHPSLALAMMELNEKARISAPLSEVKSFLSRNQSIIGQWKEFGRPGKVLGVGADGVAIELGDSYVLKLFVDESSYHKSLESMERLYSQSNLARTEAMIYDVGRMGKLHVTEIFYYIIEKMGHLPKIRIDPNSGRGSYDADFLGLRSIVQHISDIYVRSMAFHQLKKQWSESPDPQLIEIMESGIELVVEQVRQRWGEEIKSLSGRFKLATDWLERLVEEILIKYLTNRGDLHLGNLGVNKNGYIRYFDPYHRSWERGINYYPPKEWREPEEWERASDFSPRNIVQHATSHEIWIVSEVIWNEENDSFDLKCRGYEDPGEYVIFPEQDLVWLAGTSHEWEEAGQPLAY